MNGLIFDSHAHYDDKAFDSDRGELLAALPQNGVGGVVNCGASLESSRTAVALAEAYPYVYAAVGVHPEEVKGVPEDYLEQLERLAAKPKVVPSAKLGWIIIGRKTPLPTFRSVFLKASFCWPKGCACPLLSMTGRPMGTPWSCCKSTSQRGSPLLFGQRRDRPPGGKAGTVSRLWRLCNL